MQDVVLPLCFSRLQDLAFPRCEAYTVAGDDNRSDGCAGAETLQGVNMSSHQKTVKKYCLPITVINFLLV